jgi:hypothetical protein
MAVDARRAFMRDRDGVRIQSVGPPANRENQALAWKRFENGTSRALLVALRFQ